MYQITRSCWIVVSLVWPNLSHSTETAISVALRQLNGGFDIRASYQSPLTQCQAYVLLTDFSSEEPSAGIQSSKVVRLSDTVVRVEQWVEDRFLFFTSQFESIMEYTKHPISGLDFRQTKGYFKEYQGSWRLIPNAQGTLFTYQAFILPDSAIPLVVIEYFMNQRVQKRFEKMATRAQSKKNVMPERCP